MNTGSRYQMVFIWVSYVLPYRYGDAVVICFPPNGVAAYRYRFIWEFAKAWAKGAIFFAVGAVQGVLSFESDFSGPHL